MRLVESDVEFLRQENGLEGVYKQIEKCGRTCYKSEGNITEDSAKKFVDAMVKSHHGAMLEHGTVYLKRTICLEIKEENKWVGKYYANNFSKTNQVLISKKQDNEGSVVTKYDVFITTNYRVLVENEWLDDLQYICEPTDNHEKRYTLKFYCDRGVSHELVRHRKFSFAQESTRYCNYNNEKKFGKELTFVCPSWIEYDEAKDYINTLLTMDRSVLKPLFDLIFEDRFNENIKEEEKDIAIKKRSDLVTISNMILSEKTYMYLIEHGYRPEQARSVLPCDIKTEICVTGFASDWRFFFDLRLFGKTGEPHPDMLKVSKKAGNVMKFEEANSAKDLLIKESVWEEIMSYPSVFK